MADRIFELTDVVLDVEGRRKLDSFSLKADPGEAIALVGQSGSGKTSVLRVLSGLLTQTSGQVVLFGQDLATQSYASRRDILRRVGFIFEMAGVWVNRTIYDNIALPLRYHAITSEEHAAVDTKVRAVAEELGIASALGEFAPQTNNSIRKRALVARALVAEPALLLVDEPQAGMTPRESQRVSDAFERRRKGRKMTVIIADHDGYLVPFVARRVLYLEDGKIVDRPSRMPGSLRELAVTLSKARSTPPPDERHSDRPPRITPISDDRFSIPHEFTALPPSPAAARRLPRPMPSGAVRMPGSIQFDHSASSGKGRSNPFSPVDESGSTATESQPNQPVEESSDPPRPPPDSSVIAAASFDETMGLFDPNAISPLREIELLQQAHEAGDFDSDQTDDNNSQGVDSPALDTPIPASVRGVDQRSDRRQSLTSSQTKPKPPNEQ